MLSGTHLAFQLRDEKVDISSPGTVSTFGGRLKKDESEVLAISRELKEELDLDIEQEKLIYLGYFERYDEIKNHFVGCTYFYTFLNEEVNCSNEGELLILHKDEVMGRADLGRITKEMFSRLIKEESFIGTSDSYKSGHRPMFDQNVEY